MSVLTIFSCQGTQLIISAGVVHSRGLFLCFLVMFGVHRHFNQFVMNRFCLQVEYLPVMYPTLAETRNPIIFAERVRLTMARAMNTSVTQHTYEDAALAMEAVRLNIDSGSVLLEFGQFKKIAPFTVKEAKRCLNKFVIMDWSKRLVPDGATLHVGSFDGL